MSTADFTGSERMFVPLRAEKGHDATVIEGESLPCVDTGFFPSSFLLF